MASVASSPESAGSWVLRVVALIAICVAATAIRLFSVVRWESIIHEFGM